MNLYTRASSTIYYAKEENKRFYSSLKDYRLEQLINNHSIINKLLDSSLITPTSDKTYQGKLVQCGNYFQFYNFNSTKRKKDKDMKLVNDKLSAKTLHKILLEKAEDYEQIVNKSKSKELKEIALKNLNRSKLELQRLVKTNENEFKTFITLTFEDNVKEIEKSSKKFDTWRTKIKSVKKDFKYVCVPEFQKRGSIHYHLLTNITYDDFLIINENQSYQKLLSKVQKVKLIHTNKKLNHSKLKWLINDFSICLRYDNNKRLQNTKKTYSKKSRNCKMFKTVKYWSYGYSSILDMANINIVGYLTKYMTKDIDNRLFGKRRYLYSQNLKKPSTIYINIDNDKDFWKLWKSLNQSQLEIEYDYPSINGETINFSEYKIKEKMTS